MTERTESRLRDALRASADTVSTDDRAAWAAVQREVRARRRRTFAVRGAFVGAVATVVAVVAVSALRDGDDTTVDVTPAATSSSTTSATATTVPGEPIEVQGIWPFTSQDDVDAYLGDPGVGMFLDPEQTALEFAREYLGMPDPVAATDARAVETGQLYVDVLPRPGAPMTTTVWLHEYDGVHTVYRAETGNIRPDPDTLGVIVEPDSIVVQGMSTAFEAHVDVEVRDANGNVLGRSFVMGGANGELGRYEGEVAIEMPSTPTGAVILSTSSAEDGTLQEATVLRVTFAATTAEERSFSVFFHRGEELVEVHRTGPVVPGVLRQALEALLAGPTADERAAGLGSHFSAETADDLAGVTIDDRGTAVVDFAEVVGTASTAAGGVTFDEELQATIFQFPTVERIEYRLQGSCVRFSEHMQQGPICEQVPRPAN